MHLHLRWWLVGRANCCFMPPPRAAVKRSTEASGKVASPDQLPASPPAVFGSDVSSFTRCVHFVRPARPKFFTCARREQSAYRLSLSRVRYSRWKSDQKEICWGYSTRTCITFGMELLSKWSSSVGAIKSRLSTSSSLSCHHITYL